MLARDEMHRGAYETKARVKLMDEMGIWAQVILESLGFGGLEAFKLSPEVREMSIRIYNDAMAEMQEESGQRLFPMALDSMVDVEAASAEVRRAKSLGLRGSIPTPTQAAPAFRIWAIVIGTNSGRPPNCKCRSTSYRRQRIGDGSIEAVPGNRS